MKRQSADYINAMHSINIMQQAILEKMNDESSDHPWATEETLDGMLKAMDIICLDMESQGCMK